MKRAAKIREPNVDTVLSLLSTEISLGNTQPHLGRVIFRLRGKARLSQTELARRSKVDRQYLGQIEHGESEPTVSILFKISASLGKEPSRVVKLVEKEIANPEEGRSPAVKHASPRNLTHLTAEERTRAEKRKATVNRKRVDVILVDWPMALTQVMASRSDLNSQSALGKRSGVPPSTVGRILRGVVAPQVSNLERIAWAFGISLGKLAELGQGGEPVAEPTADIKGAVIDRNGEDVVFVDWSRAVTRAMASRADLKNQRLLGIRSGVPQSTVGRILRGGEDPRVSNLERIAKAFGMSLGKLAELGQGLEPVAESTADLTPPPRRRMRTSSPRSAPGGRR
jgi:transcriptional regulator with XRE-family HTH domain